MIRFVVAVVSLLAHALPALAAIPPLPDAERLRRADIVVVGTIVTVYSRTVEHSDGSDREYVAAVRVDAIEKGEVRGAGSPLYVHFAKPEARSPGWVGSQRQSRVPSEGQRLRLFARRDRDGLTFLLEPNGWDALPAAESSSEATGPAPAHSAGVRVTVLSDAFGRDASLHKDWGFAALIEAHGKRILFDAGNDSDHLAENARRLRVDLADLDFAVISHRHGDHTDGLRHVLRLQPELTIFVPRDEYFGGTVPTAFFANGDRSLPSHMRYFDGAVPEDVPHGTPWGDANFVMVERTREIVPGIRLVANLSPGPRFPETPELSLVVETGDGPLLIVGCSHPGIERILESAGAKGNGIRLLVGGLHLVTTDRAEVDRLARALRRDWKLHEIAPGHCTGEHAFAALRNAFGSGYVYAGVGTTIAVQEEGGPSGL